MRRRNDAYTNRLLMALAFVIAAAIVVAKLPLAMAGDQRVGWQVIAEDEVIALAEVRFEEGLSQLPGIILTDLPPIPMEEIRPEAPVTGEGDSEGDSEQTGLEEVNPAAPQVQRMERLVLAAAETMPEIRGGLGAYYININYPQEAIDAGIQGRLVLDFVVEPDGRASEIQLYQPLHPLCDSAAVRALRRTLFMPGRNAGQAVAVRMRLPVLFQILDPAPKADSVGTGQ